MLLENTGVMVIFDLVMIRCPVLLLLSHCHFTYTPTFEMLQPRTLWLENGLLTPLYKEAIPWRRDRKSIWSGLYSYTKKWLKLSTQDHLGKIDYTLGREALILSFPLSIQKYLDLIYKRINIKTATVVSSLMF